jgi:hypothetical protein
MYMKKKSGVWIVLLMFVCFMPFICNGEQEWADAKHHLVQDNAARIFIAKQSSKFKDALLENITSHLDQQSVSYEVEDVSALKKLNEEEYEAIVIIQYVKAGRINGNVRRYLDKTEHMDMIVLVTTSGSGDPKTDAWDVDTISTASEMSDVDKIARTVLSRLERLLKIEFAT